MWYKQLRINDLYRNIVDFGIKFDFVINLQKIKARVNKCINFKICVSAFILSIQIFYTTYMFIINISNLFFLNTVCILVFYFEFVFNRYNNIFDDFTKCMHTEILIS